MCCRHGQFATHARTRKRVVLRAASDERKVVLCAPLRTQYSSSGYSWLVMVALVLLLLLWWPFFRDSSAGSSRAGAHTHAHAVWKVLHRTAIDREELLSLFSAAVVSFPGATLSDCSTECGSAFFSSLECSTSLFEGHKRSTE